VPDPHDVELAKILLELSPRSAWGLCGAMPTYMGHSEAELDLDLGMMPRRELDNAKRLAVARRIASPRRAGG
jgi:hypothetical protein